jgi:hypothetical protein
MLSKETMKGLIDSYKGDDLAGYLWNQQDEARKIRQQYVSIRDEREKLRRDHEKALKAMDSKDQLNEMNCKHWETTYHGDPAGGSDSFFECRFCGKQAHKL